jgi:hypothetical protein
LTGEAPVRRRIAIAMAASLLLASAGSALALAPPEMTGLTAAQIVERNAQARGGGPAWRRIESMAWTGYAENSNTAGRHVPFLLEQKRPGKTRFEVVEPSGMKAIRAYDGSIGWKQRPAAAGPPEVTPYADDELSFARGAQVIEGPLMDYAARGAAISLSGIDAIDGRMAYVLAARLPSGGLNRVWVDAGSFLELRHDREFHDAAGHVSVATVRYRDYHAFEGLQLPIVIETGGGGQPVNRLVIERVALNPPIDDSAFKRPEAVTVRRGRISVDTRGAAASAARRP